MKILAIDSSLANTGIAWGSIVDGNLIITGIKLHQTAKTESKQVRASSDTVERGRSTYYFLQKAIAGIAPECLS